MQANLMLLSFLLGLLILTAISWRTFKYKNSHGFTRWLAWVGIWALVVLNAKVWVVQEANFLQQASSWLLGCSVVIATLGFLQLKLQGKAKQSLREDQHLYAFERTSVLVTNGIYAWVRHPMYLSLILLAWGAAIKNLYWLTLLLALAVSFCLYLTSKRDEQECLEYFGTAYKNYMQTTKRFIPLLW